jgi:hypothetical protein
MCFIFHKWKEHEIPVQYTPQSLFLPNFTHDKIRECENCDKTQMNFESEVMRGWVDISKEEFQKWFRSKIS